MESYELAFRMQTEVPDVIDLAARTLARWRCTASASRRPTASAAAACSPASWSKPACASCSSSKAAGIRTTTWSGPHAAASARSTSRSPRSSPICRRRGLLGRDARHLGRRVWPLARQRRSRRAKVAGRDHNAKAMAVWLAGGGVSAGQVVGATDELGRARRRKRPPRQRSALHAPAPARPRRQQAHLFPRRPLQAAQPDRRQVIKELIA